MVILKIKNLNGNRITVESINDKIIFDEIIKDKELVLSDKQYFIDEQIVTIFMTCNLHDVDSNIEVFYYGLVAVNKVEYLVRSEDLKDLTVAK